VDNKRLTPVKGPMENDLARGHGMGHGQFIAGGLWSNQVEFRVINGNGAYEIIGARVARRRTDVILEIQRRLRNDLT